MRTRSLLVAASVAGVVALGLGERDARAGDFIIGADGYAAIPFGASQNPSVGYGVDGRLGYRLSLGPIFLQPEIQGGFVSFDPTLFTRFGGGARVGLGGIVQPSLYAHAGYGTANQGVSGGFRMDAGLALDIRVVPFLSFGAHVGYDMLGTGGDPLHFIAAGGQVGVHL